MRFEVPQFIEVEDKIFGPLTWRQFVYIAGGVGIAAILFFFTPIFVFVLFGLPVAGLGIALGFIPVNDRPFSLFLEAMFSYFRKSRLYLWKKRGTGVYRGAHDTPTANTSVHFGTYAQPTGTDNLNSLSRKLELKAIQKPETDAEKSANR